MILTSTPPFYIDYGDDDDDDEYRDDDLADEEGIHSHIQRLEHKTSSGEKKTSDMESDEESAQGSDEESAEESKQQSSKRPISEKKSADKSTGKETTSKKNPMKRSSKSKKGKPKKEKKTKKTTTKKEEKLAKTRPTSGQFYTVGEVYTIQDYYLEQGPGSTVGAMAHGLADLFMKNFRTSPENARSAEALEMKLRRKMLHTATEMEKKKFKKFVKSTCKAWRKRIRQEETRQATK